MVQKFKLSQSATAVDGQTDRVSRNKSGHSPYISNILYADNEIILGQQVIAEKKNEIFRASKLIGTLDISGAIVTDNTLNTQREFASRLEPTTVLP